MTSRDADVAVPAGVATGGHCDDPVVLHRSWYRPPVEPGYSARMHPESIAAYRYPDGMYWRRAAAQR
jgi:L-fuconate dehydratase